MRFEGAASVMEMEACIMTQGLIFAIALITVVSTAFLIQMGRKEHVEEERLGDGEDLVGGPMTRVDRGKELAQTVRMVMRLKRKMRRFKERKNAQNKTD